MTDTDMQTSSSAVIALLLVVSTFGWGQSPAVQQASLKVGGKSYVFKNAAVFTADNKDTVAIFTPGRLAPNIVADLKAQNPTESSDSIVNGPYIKLVFDDEGQPKATAGQAGSSTFFTTSGFEGNVTIQGESVKGHVTVQEETIFTLSIDATIDATLTGHAALVPAAFEPPVTPSVRGTFTGNGKPAKLAFVSVEPHEEFNGKKAITLIFTEKDHTKDPKPSIKSAFGNYGSALILSVNESGGIFGCEVAHAAHAKSPFTALGEIQMEEFDMSTGNAVGHVTTPGELDTFEQKWQVDLTFAAPLPPAARQMLSAPKEKANTSTKPKKPLQKPKGLSIAAKSLPLPKSAKNVEFKGLVQQLTFSSANALPAVVEEFTRNLQAAGWKRDANPLMGPRSAIVKFTQGASKLTVMAKPAPPGTGIIVFTENLDWGNEAGSDQANRDDEEDEEEDDDEGLGDDEIEKRELERLDKIINDAFGDE